MGLAGTFLLGMAVNFIGLPSHTRGGAHIASLVFLAAHLLIVLGLVLGAGEAAGERGPMPRSAFSDGDGTSRPASPAGSLAQTRR
jgi:hypothetical protein